MLMLVSRHFVVVEETRSLQVGWLKNVPASLLVGSYIVDTPKYFLTAPKK